MVQVISSMVDIRTSCYAARLAAFSCPQKHWKALIFRGALKAAEERNLTILWILIEDCFYQTSAVSSYQAVYSPARPLASLAPKALNAAIDDICSIIVQAIREPRIIRGFIDAEP